MFLQSTFVNEKEYEVKRKEFLLNVKTVIERCLAAREIKKNSKKGREIGAIVMAVMANTVVNDPAFYVATLRADIDELDIAHL